MERVRERNTRERGKGERSHDNHWTVVTRRKSKPHQPSASKTCFINHLPLSTTISDLSQIFKIHGAISNIHIPTFQKYPTHKFAFVQFYYPQSLTTAIRDENGRQFAHKRISVFPAKHDMFINHNKIPESTPAKPKPVNGFTSKGVHFSLRDNRTYKDAASSPNPHTYQPKNSTTQPPLHTNTYPTPTTTTSQNYENQKPNMSTPKPSKNRIMNSRALGEETENVRNNLKPIDIDSDFAAAMNG